MNFRIEANPVVAPIVCDLGAATSALERSAIIAFAVAADWFFLWRQVNRAAVKIVSAKAATPDDNAASIL